MARSKEMFAVCALALGTLAAVTAPALAGDQAPFHTADRSQTIGVPDRNATLLPGADERHGAAAGSGFQVS
ncbi:hypothetical protein FM076_14245 [Streptomyces albus subsp. chlorinus]|uniref:hypothetical protein n=1 Tax=Streptomyces albus TaxID=1888 RepID=UPI00156DAD43|nr:hypothetical protein [Streptomyces albus]NSC22286.1 hypothetical protein [Streptomyces albus subsp. chlorinus]